MATRVYTVDLEEYGIRDFAAEFEESDIRNSAAWDVVKSNQAEAMAGSLITPTISISVMQSPCRRHTGILDGGRHKIGTLHVNGVRC
jgi:hypothetical protein